MEPQCPKRWASVRNPQELLAATRLLTPQPTFRNFHLGEERIPGRGLELTWGFESDPVSAVFFSGLLASETSSDSSDFSDLSTSSDSSNSCDSSTAISTGSVMASSTTILEKSRHVLHLQWFLVLTQKPLDEQQGPTWGETVQYLGRKVSMECNLVVLCLIEKLVSDRFVERQSQEGIGLSASTAMSVLHTGHHLPWEHPQQD